MSFWRKEVVQPSLDQETRQQMEQQLAWIEREPGNPHPYHHLAEFYRMEGRHEEALGLFLHAVYLDPGFTRTHAALAEMYAIRSDYAAAWRHARLAEQGGEPRGVELLQRFGVPEERVR